MRAKDWVSISQAKVLIIGEEPTLQWSDDITEYVLFADYYFRKMPYDHGERSRYIEAKSLFDHVDYLSAKTYGAESIYITDLCNDRIPRAPKGKRTLIPEDKARRGIEHIRWILEQNPTIEVIFAISLQVNYWLQKLGFYMAEERFIAEAQPRNNGLQNEPPYYQPVEGKSFSRICGNIFSVNGYPAKLIPILPAKDFPLKDRNLDIFGNAYENIRQSFLQK